MKLTLLKTRNRRITPNHGTRTMFKVLPVVCFVAALSACSVTPEPLTLEELRDVQADRMQALGADQEPVSGSISLYEAMARAIKYNLDYKVEMFEEALRVSETKLTRFDLLPDVVISAGLNNRDSYNGSRSVQLFESDNIGEPSESVTTSSDRTISDAALLLSWDTLDFGLSYVRAKQSTDTALIANERKRKVINRVIANVRTAYWRAVSAERMIAQLREFESDIEEALSSSEDNFEKRQTAPLAALHYQRELLEIQQQIQDMQSEMNMSKMQLAALMNLDPSTQFTLDIPDRATEISDLKFDSQKLVDTALLNRPELRELTYEQRINKKEAQVALLELLPSLSLFGGFNYNDNDYLFNNHWTGLGAKATWNIINAFRYPTKKRLVEVNGELLDQKALALTMAVITQVHVSARQYEVAKRKINTVRKFNKVSGNIRDQIQAGFQSRKVSYQTFVRENMNSIVADAQYDLAYAELQNRYADIFTAIGLQVYGDTDAKSATVAELTEHLKGHWMKLLKSMQ